MGAWDCRKGWVGLFRLVGGLLERVLGIVQKGGWDCSDGWWIVEKVGGCCSKGWM